MKCSLAKNRYCAALSHHAQHEGVDSTKGIVITTLHHKTITTMAIGRCVVYRTGVERKQTALNHCPWCGAALGVYKFGHAKEKVEKAERALPADAEAAPDAVMETSTEDAPC